MNCCTFRGKNFHTCIVSPVYSDVAAVHQVILYLNTKYKMNLSKSQCKTDKMSKYTIINIHDTVAIRRNPTCYFPIDREPVFAEHEEDNNDSESVHDYCRVVVFFSTIVLVSIVLHELGRTIF